MTPLLITRPFISPVIPSGESGDLRTLASAPSGWTPWALEFKDDGTKAYVTGHKTLGVDQTFTYAYNLSTPWDVTTISYSGEFYESTAEDPWGQGNAFGAGGTKMYLGGGNTNTIYQYELSVAWDISTASYASKSYAVPNGAQSVAMKRDDGARMYTTGHFGNEVVEHIMSTNWDIATASVLSTTSSLVSAEVSQTSSLAFKTDGQTMYVIGYGNDTVAQFPMVAAWVTATAANPSITYDVSGEEIGPTGLALHPSGKNMYVVGTQHSKIIQYALGSDWDVSTASPT